jgi:hypothetical protein
MMSAPSVDSTTKSSFSGAAVHVWPGALDNRKVCPAAISLSAGSSVIVFASLSILAMSCGPTSAAAQLLQKSLSHQLESLTTRIAVKPMPWPDAKV